MGFEKKNIYIFKSVKAQFLMYFVYFRYIIKMRREHWPATIAISPKPKRVGEVKYYISEVRQTHFHAFFNVFRIFHNIREIHRSRLFATYDGDKAGPNRQLNHILGLLKSKIHREGGIFVVMLCFLYITEK